LIWCLPAALCSIAIALILKVNERRGGSRIVLAGANYIVASILALLLLRGKASVPSGPTLTLGISTGIVYVLGFLVLMKGISRGPLAVPVTVMRLSVAVPVIVSIAIWSESPGSYQLAGLAAGFAAIVLFGLGIGDGGERGKGGRGFYMIMIAMFLVMGLGDVLLKAFREISPDYERLSFTWILFTVAALFTWLVALAGRVRVKRSTFLLGLLLGIPNLFSTVFTLLALRSIPASVTFPFINLTVIFGSTLLGFIFWGEKLGRIATAGLIAAAVALVLLPI
jgi:drug/metabolite transporter (DMT)-like permease